MLKYQNVSFSYKEGEKALSDISFYIQKGEKVGLIGANGAGKSTLLKTILGLLIPNGELFFDNIKIEKKNLVKIRQKVGLVMQNCEQQMFMPTVREDMLFGPTNYGMKKEEAMKKAETVLNDLGVSYLMDSYNHQLSGGEKKMAAIATILMMEPELILLDEPSSSLDPKNRRRVINILNGLPQTKIISSHDLDFIWDTCDRVLLMNKGKIVADGNKEEILTNKELLEANDLELPFRFMWKK